MDLYSLMADFAKIPGAAVGRGPKHPVKPMKKLAGPVRDYLEGRPYLTRYPDFVAFLESYAGAGIYSKEPTASPNYTFLTIYGFGDFADDFTPEVDANGFHGFSCFEFRQRRPELGNPNEGLVFLHCALDATAQRPNEIYRPTPAKDTYEYQPAWRTFVDGLAEVVENRGRVRLPRAWDKILRKGKPA